MSDPTKAQLSSKTFGTPISSRRVIQERVSLLLKGSKDILQQTNSARPKQVKPAQRRCETQEAETLPTDNSIPKLSQMTLEQLDLANKLLEDEVRSAQLILDSVRTQNKIYSLEVGNSKLKYKRFLNQKIITRAEERAEPKNTQSHKSILRNEVKDMYLRMQRYSKTACIKMRTFAESNKERNMKAIYGIDSVVTVLEHTFYHLRKRHSEAKEEHASLVRQNDDLRNKQAL